MTTEIVKLQSGGTIQEIVSWELLVQRFITSLDAKPATILLYKKGLSYFIKWLEGAQPTPGNILAYKKALQERTLASFTINAYLTAVRRFFAWLEAEGVCPNIARAIKGLKQNDQSKEALTGVQCRRLLDSISLNGSLSRRDYAMLNLMIRTGLRTIEVVRANIGDIRNEGAETVLDVQGKGRDGKDRFVVLTSDAQEPIRDYIPTRGAVSTDDPLFVVIPIGGEESV